MRISWRWMLPVVQLGAYVVMVWYGCRYRETWVGWLKHSGAGADWICWGRDPLDELAAGINFPAAVVGSLPLNLDIWPNSGAVQQLASHVGTALAIPFLWYFIGRGIDRRGSKPRKLRSKIVRFLAWVGVVLLSLMALLLIASMVREPSPPYMGGLPTLVWLGVGVYLLLKRLRGVTGLTGSAPPSESPASL